MAKLGANAPCACGAGRKYKRCCGPLHRGLPAASPEILMRSRYCAYAIGHADYIIATTDPTGPMWVENRVAWRADILQFGERFDFTGVEIHDTQTEGDLGTVTFHALLSQNDRDASFSETSRFQRVNDRWLYHSAVKTKDLATT